MKENKTTDELIQYLLDKNVKINDIESAKKNIEKYTYYGIINTYKYIFKDRNNNYKPNVSFEEILSLFLFDKAIKSLFLNYLLEIELTIKSKIANLFSAKYGIEDYLKVDNFDNNANKNDIQDLLDEINKEITGKHNRKHNAVKHYLDKYNFVPPFVLVKILSFGTMSKMYGLMKQSDRQEISKIFKVSDNLLRQILKNLASIRNICAHSDRLYCYRSIFYISFKNIDSTYKNKDNSTNLYILIQCMIRLLDEESASKFEKELNNEIKILSDSISSVKIRDILRIMGYND